MMGQGGYATVLAYKGRQRFQYDGLLPIGSVNTQHTRTKIIDTLWRLNFKMGQEGY